MSATHALNAAESTVAHERFTKTRKAAKTGMALLASFFIPFLGTIAFVAFYPPFWNPKLAASVVSMGILGAVALVLLLLVAWRPVRRLQADLAAGQAIERVGSIAKLERQGPLLRLTLSDEPKRAVVLDPGLVDAQVGAQLKAGVHVRIRQLPQSGCLLSLALASPSAVTAS